jgi:hypothetical protein
LVYCLKRELLGVINKNVINKTDRKVPETVNEKFLKSQFLKILLKNAAFLGLLMKEKIAFSA